MGEKLDELRTFVELERSKLNREKSHLLLDKSMLLYFSFLFVGVIGFINNYINFQFLNILVLMSFAVLIIGVIPYILTMHKEGTKLNIMLSQLDKDKQKIKSGSKNTAKKPKRGKKSAK